MMVIMCVGKMKDFHVCYFIAKVLLRCIILCVSNFLRIFMVYHKMRHLWFNFVPIKEIITMKTIKSKTIQFPEGVILLIENMWLRHKAGMK